MPSSQSGEAHSVARNPHEHGLPELEPSSFTASGPCTPPIVLTIAGFDPSSGAGITADLKVISAWQLYGISAVTALTIQSTEGVQQSRPVDSGLLHETLLCLQKDVTIAATKIGMLGSAQNVATVAAWLANSRVARERVIFDPVLRSSSGKALLEEPGLAILKGQLLPRVGWITPNLNELALLSGLPVTNREQMLAAAQSLAAAADLRVVATGGHLDPPDDLLVNPSGEARWFPGVHLPTRATHGTGCAFSSALTCRLVLGDSPEAAVAAAKQYVREAMQAAYPVGRGRGPMHHLYAGLPAAQPGKEG